MPYRRNFIALLAIASIAANCILGFLLYKRSTISNEGSKTYATFQNALEGALQRSNQALKDSGQQVQYDVNEQNHDLTVASNILRGMQPEATQHGIDFSYVVNALELAYIPNLNKPSVVKKSNSAIGLIYTALEHTTYDTGSLSNLRKIVTSLDHKLSS